MSSDQAVLDEFVTALEIRDDVNVPAWSPTATEGPDKTDCQNCGGTVTLQFRRVFGDNDDVAHRCPDCSSFRELSDGEAHEQ